jgi:hypothetical protein
MDPNTKDLAEAIAAMATTASVIGGGLLTAGAGIVWLYKRFSAKQSIAAAAFGYPAVGEAGKNILSQEVRRVRLGATHSMSAVVPERGQLMVRVTGEAFIPSVEPGQGPGAMGAWFYTAIPVPLIWQPRAYDAGTATDGPAQVFSCQKPRGGRASDPL